jgi:hypothetical protein
MTDFEAFYEQYKMLGHKLASISFNAGQTIAFFDTQTLYDGIYIITIENGTNVFSKKVVINKD